MTNKISRTLSDALSRNKIQVMDAQGSYQDDVLSVSNQMAAVMASSLPLLNNLPDNWNEITDSYTQARSDALSWTNDVYAQLYTTPDSVVGYSQLIDSLFDDAIAQAQILITDPQNSTALSALNLDIKNIKNELRMVNIFISGCQSSINRFGVTTLPNQAQELTTVTNDAYTDYNIDEEKIADFKKQIDAVNAEIIALSVEIGVNGAAVIAGCAVGVVMLYAPPPVDIAGLIMLGVGVGVGLTTIALDAIQLQKDIVELAQLQSQMDSYTEDASLLQNCADSFSALATSSVALSGSVDGIASAWKSVEDDMTAAIDELSDAINDVAFADYQAVYDDLVASKASWDETYSECALLEINVQGTPAVLQTGQTQEQTSSAIESNPPIDFVTYINNFPTPSYATQSAKLVGAN